MSNEQQRPDVRRLWQSQVEENTSMSLEDLRSGARKINRIILTRALGAGLGFLIFIGFFGVLLTSQASPPLVTETDIEILRRVFLIGAGCGFWLLVSLLRRARGKSVIDGEPSACAAFYRSEVERQRNSARRSAVWVPVVFSALWAWGFLLMQRDRLVTIVIWLLFVPFWIYHNIELAKTSQRELEKLNASGVDLSGLQGARASWKAPRD
jgi:hypothetical protein